MPENVASPTPPDPKKKHEHGEIDKKHLLALDTFEQIARSSLKENFAQILTDGGISPAFVTDFGNAVKFGRGLATGAVAKTHERKDDTLTETQAKTDLLAKVEYIHTRAEQQYAATPGNLDDYNIGKQFYRNRDQIIQSVNNILTKLESDTLPGVGPSTIVELSDALENFEQTKSAQKGAQGDATGNRAQLTKLIPQIKTSQIQIQLAIQAAYPHTDPANAGVRKEFGLPLNKPLRIPKGARNRQHAAAIARPMRAAKPAKGIVKKSKAVAGKKRVIAQKPAAKKSVKAKAKKKR